MVHGRVKYINDLKPFGYIQLDQAWISEYGTDVLFNFRNVLHNARLRRNDIVEFKLERIGEKWKATHIQLAERSNCNTSLNLGNVPFDKSARSNPAVSEAQLSEEFGSAVDIDDSDQRSCSARFDAKRASYQHATTRPAAAGQSLPTNKSTLEDLKLPRQCHVGHIVNIGYKHGSIKPLDDLPTGYLPSSLVSFDPAHARSGQLPLITGDQVSFTLGTKDKARPLAFGVQLYKGKLRTSTEIKKHIDKLLRIVTRNLKARTKEDLASTDLNAVTNDYFLDIVTCEAMWETVGNTADLPHETISILIDTVIEVEKKAVSMRRAFIGLLDALAKTHLFDTNTGNFRLYVQHIVQTRSEFQLIKIQQFLMLMMQNVPDKTRTAVSLIRLMIPPDSSSLDNFLFATIKEITRQNCSEPDHDMEWSDMTLVPTSTELTGLHGEYFSNLRPVIEKGSYGSTHEYLDIYFRLLRADCFGSICKRVRELCNSELDYRDMNVYHPVEMHGIAPTSTDSGMTILLEIHSCVPVKDWATTSKLMYGNLLCISPSGTFKDAIWVTVANRDLDMLQENRITVELCSCNQYNVADALIRMYAAGNEMMAVESPTYYNAYRPVLASLQTLNPEELPFQDELITGRCSEAHVPQYIQVSLNDLAKEGLTNSELKKNENVTESFFSKDSVESENLTDTLYSKLSSNWPRKLDVFQRRALQYIFTHRVACVQGPPGTGKSFIGTVAVRTILEMVNRPDGPILVMTYKNHALDEFLKDLIQYYPGEVIRVGGRSKEEKLMKCNINFNEVKARVIVDKTLQHAIINKRYEIDRTATLVQKSINNLERSLEFSELTVAKYLTKGQLCTFIKNYRSRLTTKSSSDKILSELDRHHGPNWNFFAGNPDRLRIFRAAVKQWTPMMSCIRRTPPKHLQDFQAKLQKCFSKAATTNVNEIVEEDDSLNEEEVKEINEERFAATSRGIFYNGISSVINFRFQNGCSILTKCLDFPDEPEDKVLLNTPDIWTLSAIQRQRLVLLLLRMQTGNRLQSFQTDVQHYEQLCCEKKELDDQHKIRVMQSAKIIGMTVTGASIYSHLLKAVKPAIIVIEEAAEVLEPQIIATLGNWVQHLIMIGDHKQLRPPVENYELVKHFHLDLSMMERLINNNIPYKSLAIQNRMRPEFATMLKDLYEDLQDGAKVHLNEPVNCIEKSMFFWDHTDPEEHSRSFLNHGEAKRIVRLAVFLVHQGYHPNKITILAAYQGQVKLLRQKFLEAIRTWKEVFSKYMSEQTGIKFDGVLKGGLFKVHTIDMYQGDENDIIIISLVRSNTKKAIGFLKTLNRRCVAQSRARCGMYFCGNSNTFSNDPNWSWMINKMKEVECFGSAIPLRCPKHPENQVKAETDTDIKILSFCKILCNTVMSCGLHNCKDICHSIHTHSKCMEEVEFNFTKCGHAGKKLCFENENNIQCNVPCDKLMGCKIHMCLKRCFQIHSHFFCDTNVKFHCSKCGKENHKHCSDLESKIRCKHTVQFVPSDCDHINIKLCYEVNKKCTVDCLRILPKCGHKCSLTCGETCNPAACRVCRKINKIEKRKQEAELEAQKQKFKIDIRKELEEIKASVGSESKVQFIELDESTSDDVLEYNSVKDRVERFIQPEHEIKIKVKSIKKVVNLKLREAYLSCRESLIDPTVSDLKFHGTNAEAVKAICSDGFRLPESCGMFGAGIYFATDSSKSERYSRESSTLLICEVAMGKVFVAETAMKQMNLEKLISTGCDSLYAKRNTRSTRGVLFDEFVIYRPEQAIPKYVIEYVKLR